jgi:hypothetical protein
MTAFSVAAFLKIVSLNAKPQKTELRKRLFGTGGRPYDYHRSLKLAAGKLLVDGLPLGQLLEAAEAIKNPAERVSLIEGLTKLFEWRVSYPGDVYKVPARIYDSPNKLFKISIQPEFGILNASGRTAFCLWNTKSVDLKFDAAYNLLAAFPGCYERALPPVDDFGLLSLREPKLLRLSERAISEAEVLAMMMQVEHVILDLYDEAGRHLPPPGPFPTAA